MVFVNPTTDLAYVKSVLIKPGMYRCVSECSDQPPSMDEVVKDPLCKYLEVVQDAAMMGFISFVKLTDTGWMIHLCLRTKGIQTKLAIEKALVYAKKTLRATEIYAIYSSKRASVNKLCDFFGFTDSELLRVNYYVPGAKVPIAYKSLAL